MILPGARLRVFLYAEPMIVGRGLNDAQHEELRRELSKMTKLRELSDSHWGKQSEASRKSTLSSIDPDGQGIGALSYFHTCQRRTG